MNEKDRQTFFQQIQPKLSNNEYIMLIEMYGELENSNTNLRRKNKELRDKLKSK